MPSSIEVEIRERVAQYVAGDLSLREFQEWFVPRAWGMDAADDVRAAERANEIELFLAEFSNGDWSEGELREKLRREGLSSQVAKCRVDVAGAPWLVTSTSSSLGWQPARATRYFGALPLFARPRIQVGRSA